MTETNTLVELGLTDKVQEYLEQEKYYTNVARRIQKEYNILLSERTLCRYISDIDKKLNKDEFDQATKMAVNIQKLQDQNRIDKKIFREDARVISALEEYHNSLQELLRNYDISEKFAQYSEATIVKSIGIFHLTDAHLNEIIELANNSYDFRVASSRLKQFTQKAILYFKASGVDKVLFACTGDIINSDRRLDELLNAAVNRAKATFIAVDLIKQCIQELNQFWPIDVAYVTGNESRLTEHIHWSEFLVTDNYDFNVFNILNLLLADVKGIKFIHGDPLELVVNVLNHNILLIHGHQNGLGKSNVAQKDIQSIVGKYANQHKVNIDFVLFGHIHSAYISDTFARGSSLSGGNIYSDKALQFSSRASQNLHIVTEDGIDSIKIDLQNVTNEGYETSYKEVKMATAKQKEIVHKL